MIGESESVLQLCSRQDEVSGWRAVFHSRETKALQPRGTLSSPLILRSRSHSVTESVCVYSLAHAKIIIIIAKAAQRIIIKWMFAFPLL